MEHSARSEILGLLRHLGMRISLEQWRDAQRDGQAPRPVQYVERGQPRWSRVDVTHYALGLS